MTEKTLHTLRILAESAKYDASCASSGSSRKNSPGGVGNALPSGVCHSFSADGRCISLLKVLLSNRCRFDCAYCVNRRSSDVPRASFEPEELASLVMGFYRRNYIEGLFLSSAVQGNADNTMERMVEVLRLLRKRHRFNGYIHMKAIPGASRELVEEAGRHADRLSVNIEIPSEASLKRLAPEKDYQSVYTPMRHIHEGTLKSRDERRRFRHAPAFAPAGQCTQMIVGACRENDRSILRLASFLYKGPQLARVYYSAFIPIGSHDPRLPALAAPPLEREHRLYQADWLMRLYHFDAEEILTPEHPNLDPEVDPKLAWALRHPELFPVDPNKADYRELLRVPGIGPTCAERIVTARRCRKLSLEHIAKLGAVMKRARFFLTPQSTSAGTPAWTIREAGPAYVRRAILDKKERPGSRQLSLFSLL